MKKGLFADFEDDDYVPGQNTEELVVNNLDIFSNKVPKAQEADHNDIFNYKSDLDMKPEQPNDIFGFDKPID